MEYYYEVCFFCNGFISKSIIKYIHDKSKVLVYSRSYGSYSYKVVYYNALEHTDTLVGLLKEDIVIYAISTKVPGSNYSEEEIDVELEALSKVIKDVSRFQISKFVLISSASVYGFNSETFSEASSLNPLNSYGNLKVQMENLLINNMKKLGIDYLVLRLANIFGDSNAKQGIINLLIDKKRVQPLLIKNGGEDVRDFLYDRDLSIMVTKLLDSIPNFKIYNVSSNLGTRVKNVIGMLTELDSSIISNVKFEQYNGIFTVNILDNSRIYSEILDFKSMDLKSALLEVLLDRE